MKLNKLRFSTLRIANMMRIPKFVNRHGHPAHKKSNGSDWSPAQWLQALVGELGELGELAQCRILYETGELSFGDYKKVVAKEAADVITYLDIFMARCLDKTEGPSAALSHAQLLMGIVATLGEYANERKKYERGDWTQAEYERRALVPLSEARMQLHKLSEASANSKHVDVVKISHLSGIDLGEAIEQKWNEVSKRVDCNLSISEIGVAEGNLYVSKE